VAAGERVDLGHRGAVEVAGNGLLQRARGDGEAQRRVERAAVEQRVDETGGEAVAAADAVDQAHHVALALVQGRGRRIPQQRAPAVVAGRQALAQRHGDQRRAELARDALGGIAVAARVEHPGGDVRAGHLDPEHRLQVLFVGDDDVDLSHQRPHRRLGLRLGPQLLAVVQIDADARAGALRRAERGGGRCRRLRPERRRDAGDVEPGRARHHLVPVLRAGGDLADRRMRAVVDHRARPLAGAGLGEIDADPTARANDERGVDAFGAQRAHRRVANRVRRQAGDVAAVQPELRQARGHVGFAAAEGRREHRRLEEPLEPGRAEPQHQLAEGDDFFRHPRAAATLATTWRAFAVIWSQAPASTARGSTSAEPTPTAAAPARIQSPAFVSVTPPVGISFTCGSGPRTSLMNPGPSAVAGNSLTMSAPLSWAARISVGEKHPGITATSRAWHAATTSGLNTGLTTNTAPASTTACAVAASVTVPAPSRNPSGSAGASSRIKPTAPGTVIVTSIARTPPRAIASTTSRSFAGSLKRITATTPSASMRAVTAARCAGVTAGMMPSTMCG